MKSWSVYLLECSDGSFYCGVTRDIPLRLAQHNGAKPGGARYTSGRRPVVLLAAIHDLGRSEAFRLEARIKRMPRKAKLPFFREYS